MTYRSNSNKEVKPGFNPLEIFRQYYAGYVPAYFSPVYRAIHIQLSLNCRLRNAVDIHCRRISDLVIISQDEHRRHKKNRVVLKQRVIESNQYDNLSPPR